MKASLLLFITLVIGIWLFSCNRNSTGVDPEPDPTKDLHRIATGELEKTLVTVYSDASLQTGYCRIYVLLKDRNTGKVLQKARIQMTPIMDMGDMKHSAPCENPQTGYAENGLFPCGAVFIMSGTWQLEFLLQELENGDAGKVVVPVQVAPANRLKQETGSDSAHYFLALVEPRSPKVGINTFEITIHQQESMMAFPAVTDVEVTMEPTMPSMGHGSPNNEHPIHKGKGHYRGKVNFTMSGAWQIALRVSRNGQLLLQTMFDLQVP